MFHILKKMGEVLTGNKQTHLVLKEPVKLKNNLCSLFDMVKLSRKKIVSVELCTNRDLNMEALDRLSPAFTSVVWHSYSANILREVSTIPAILLCKQLSLQGNQVLLHLAGRHLSKLQLLDILQEMQKINVRNIFVLQGEPSHENKDKPDFQYASDLMKFVKQNFDNYFCMGVAAYPEAHPLSPSKSNDLKYLKMKVDSGAKFIITQMIFDFEIFNQFLNECKEIGITVPIIPGLYIIDSFESLNQTAAFCRVDIPKNISKILMDNRENPAAIRNYGIFQCSQLVKQLLSIHDKQVIGVHFFSHNNIELVNKVCKILGLRDDYVERPIGRSYL